MYKKLFNGLIILIVLTVIGAALVSPVFMVDPKPVKYSLVVSVQQTIDSVVHIRNTRNNSVQLQGSGVLVAPDLVLTARHVAETGENFDIMTNDGKVYKATRAITSKKYDLGFIKLEQPVSNKVAKLGSIKDCKLGEAVYAVGSPYGDINFNSVTLGIISALRRDLEKFGCPADYGMSVTFQTDAACHPGNSGCPVFSLDGVVRGIVVGGFSNAIIYCIPIDYVIQDVEIVQRMFDEDRYQREEDKTPTYYPMSTSENEDY